MKSTSKSAFILESSRIPFVKSQGAYSKFTRKQLMVAAVEGLIGNAKLDGRLIGDTALGAVMNSSADFNLAREVVLETSLHPESPAYNVQRACGTGLENVWQIALKAHTGAIDIGIAGGVDTNSDLPIEVSHELQRALLDLNKAKTLGDKLRVFARLRPGYLKPAIPSVTEPRTLLSMGEHCELMVKEWGITRQEQDELALASHKHGAQAYESGFYRGLVRSFAGLDRDALLRADTSLEKLAQLRPAFDFKAGTLTAGNSSPLTDGAACVLIGNEDGASQLGLKPLAKLIDVQVAAVNFVKGAGLLMAPTKAVANLLSRNKLTFADFDFFELHEAFAGQVLCNIKALASDEYSRKVLGWKGAVGEIDRTKMNLKGSSVALGHPFAATGARIVGTLAKMLAQDGPKRGLVSICTAGGMAIAAIMESV